MPSSSQARNAWERVSSSTLAHFVAKSSYQNACTEARGVV